MKEIVLIVNEVGDILARTFIQKNNSGSDGLASSLAHARDIYATKAVLNQIRALQKTHLQVFSGKAHNCLKLNGRVGVLCVPAFVELLGGADVVYVKNLSKQRLEIGCETGICTYNSRAVAILYVRNGKVEFSIDKQRRQDEKS